MLLQATKISRMPCRQTSPWSTFPSQPSTCSPPSRRPRTEWTSSSGGCRTLFRGIPTPQALVEGTKIFDWPKVVIRLSYLWAWLDCWRLQDFCCPPPSRCWTGGPPRSRTPSTPWRRRTSQSNFSSVWSFFVRESFNEIFFSIESKCIFILWTKSDVMLSFKSFFTIQTNFTISSQINQLII